MYFSFFLVVLEWDVGRGVMVSFCPVAEFAVAGVFYLVDLTDSSYLCKDMTTTK